MKVILPEELKKDVPPTTFGKILTATPIVMAVLATMLAGLASSEMTRAQYDRSLAAQQQSKAGDQWSFFQAKRLRGAYQRNTADLLQAMAEVRPLEPKALKNLAEQLPNTPEATKLKTDLLSVLESPAGQQSLGMLQKGELPLNRADTAVAPQIKAALDAVESLKPDPEVAASLAAVSNQALEEALRAARDQVQAFDAITRPVNQTIDQLEDLLSRQTALLPKGGPAAETSAAGTSVNRGFTAARLKYAGQRFDV
jgi:hypothetical protein